MTVTVNDILHMEGMGKAVVLAGGQGIGKAVRRIATIEKPYGDHREYCERVARPGDFYVSKCYAYQGDSEKLYEELMFMHRTRASGLVTYREALPLLCGKILSAAESCALPIIILDDDYGLTEFSYNVIDLILKDKLAAVHSASILRLLREAPGEAETAGILHEIYPDAASHITAAFFRCRDMVSVNVFRLRKDDLIMPLHDGYVYLLSADSAKELLALQRRLSGLFHRFAANVTAGFSDIQAKSIMLRQAILESIYAASHAQLLQKTVSNYQELGLYAFLAVPENRTLLEKYHARFHAAIHSCDRENKLDYPQLTRAWVVSGGDFSFVARQMFISENTVRYRLNKLHDAWDSCSPAALSSNDFYAAIKAAVCAESLLRDPLLAYIFD